MKINQKFTCLVHSKAANDLLAISADVTLIDDAQSNYLQVTKLENLKVEGGFELSEAELEEFKLSVIDAYYDSFLDKEEFEDNCGGETYGDN